MVTRHKNKALKQILLVSFVFDQLRIIDDWDVSSYDMDTGAHVNNKG